MTTPDFPAWSNRLAAQWRRLWATQGASLQQLEALFQHWIPHYRLAAQDDGPHSRCRAWPLRLTFWSFLWQVTQAGASCREAIRQAQSLCWLQGQPVPPDQTSPYCQARSRLPLERLDEIHHALVQEAERAVAPQDHWCGHRVMAVDGTTVDPARHPREPTRLSATVRPKARLRLPDSPGGGAVQLGHRADQRLGQWRLADQ